MVLATGNPGKLRQFSELLGPSGLMLLRQSDFNIEPPPETGNTFLENSLLKARNAARLTGLAAIADDSGIEVDALGGRPGLYSARYAGEGASDEQNLRKMLLEMENVPAANRGARYRSIIVFVLSADDPAPLIGEGVWEGTIATGPRGTLRIVCSVAVHHKTGVEMEALVGASVAALTIYDMCKALSHDIVIADTRLVEKRGGKSDIG